ncbi:hypothetical protein ACOMHN_062471 [Nucella lapillus]
MARDEAVALCHDWMLEFVCHDMWDKFKTGCDIDQALFDLTNGVILAQKYRSGEDIRSKEVVFLMLTSTLMSLKKSLISESQGTPRQIDFQNIVRMVADLSAMCDSDCEDVTEKMPEVYTKTVLQRILEFCRQDQYPTAELLYDEVADELDKETSRKVQAILHAKSKPHRFLGESSIEDYLSTMMTYLDAVYTTFPDQPVMMKHAKYYLTNGARYNRVRSEYFSREIDEGVEGGWELRDKEERTLSKKLQALRKRKLREAALCDENQNNNHDSGDEDTVVVRTSESDSQSRSPRKKHAGRSERESRTAEATTDSTHRSSHQSKHRSDTKQRSTDSGSHRVDSLEGASVSIESVDEQDTDSESDEGDHNLSLKTRMPLKIATFNKRPSLSSASANPPTRRRKAKLRHKWTNREEKEFYLAVQQYGVGDWQSIRRHLKTDRSNVQLKDKWRNINATNYELLCAKHGPV